MFGFFRIFLITTVCLLVSFTLAFGSKTPEDLVKKRELTIGPAVRYYNYKKDDANVEIDGIMYGIAGDFNYHGIRDKNNLMVDLSFEVLDGNLDYEGETLLGTSINEDTDDRIINVKGSAGYEFFLSKNMLVSLYTGLAYRYWYDGIEGPRGYERRVRYWYSPVGLKTHSALSKKWIWGLTAEYKFLWDGDVKSYLSDVDAGYNDPEIDMNVGDGYGLEFAVSFKRKLQKNYVFIVEPYISYWKFDKSSKTDLKYNGQKIDEVHEPENYSNSYGLRLSFGF